MKIVLIYSASWLGMVILAILNGTIREKAYGNIMGELPAHQLSTLTGPILLGMYILMLTGLFRIESSSRQAFLIGSIWLLMTVVFEFIFGHYVMGHPWKRLLNDYNILKGRIWSLMLLWTCICCVNVGFCWSFFYDRANSRRRLF
jgi:hypothetical protein